MARKNKQKEVEHIERALSHVFHAICDLKIAMNMAEANVGEYDDYIVQLLNFRKEVQSFRENIMMTN